jgi:hypothetical protein
MSKSTRSIKAAFREASVPDSAVATSWPARSSEAGDVKNGQFIIDNENFPHR